MKNLEFLKLSLIIMGSVIGAGFITGKELIRFFGTENFIPSIYISCVIFFFFAYVLMDIGRRYGSIKQANKMIFKSYSKWINAFLYLSLIIIAGGMLGGINSLLTDIFQLPKTTIIIPLICVVLANIISAHGLDAVIKVNIIVVPLMLVFIMYFMFEDKNFSYVYTDSYDAFNAVILAIFYPSMNMFLSSPILINAGSKFKYGLKKASFLASFSLFICMALILSAICFEGSNAIMLDMPMLYITGSAGLLSKIFMSMVFLAMFINLCTSYFPAYQYVSTSKKQTVKKIILSAVVLVMSTFGLGKVVKYFYPLLGIFGLIYLLVCCFYMASEKHLIKPLFKRAH